MPVSTPRPCTRSTADDEPAVDAVAVASKRRQRRASRPGPTARSASRSSRPCAAASRTTGARRVHQRAAASARPGRSGSTAGLPVRSCGGVHSASAQSRGDDAEVAVLDAGMEAHAVAAVAERGVERGDDRVALLAREVAGGEVDHACRSSSRRDEVAAVRDLVGRELDAHRRGLDRRATGVVPAGSKPRIAMLPTSLPGGSPAGITAARPTSAARGERARRGMRAASSGVRPPSSASGTSAQPSGTKHDVLHRRDAYATADPRALRLGTGRARASAVPIATSLAVARGRPALRRRRPRCSGGDDSTRQRRPTPPAPTTTTATSTTAPTTTDRPPPTSTRVRVALTQVAGLERPDRDGRPPGRRARCTSPSRPGAGRARCATGSSSPTPVLDISSRSAARAATSRACSGSRSRPTASKLYVDYTDPQRRHPRRRVHDARDGRADPASRAGVLLSVHQPQPNHNGGEVAFGPDGMLYIGLGDGGGAERPGPGTRAGRQRPDARHAARQDPAHRPDADRGRAVHDPGRQPVRRRAGGAARDLDVRAAQPVALLVRPRDRRPVDRRRRPERVRGDRLQPAGQGAGAELRLEPSGGLPRVPGQRARDDVAPVSSSRTPTATARSSAATCTGARGSRPCEAPTSSATTAIRRSARSRSENGRVVGQRDLGVTLRSVSSFGQDADGELYVLSLSNGLYRVDPAA